MEGVEIVQIITDVTAGYLSSSILRVPMLLHVRGTGVATTPPPAPSSRDADGGSVCIGDGDTTMHSPQRGGGVGGGDDIADPASPSGDVGTIVSESSPAVIVTNRDVYHAVWARLRQRLRVSDEGVYSFRPQDDVPDEGAEPLPFPSDPANLVGAHHLWRCRPTLRSP